MKKNILFFLLILFAIFLIFFIYKTISYNSAFSNIEKELKLKTDTINNFKSNNSLYGFQVECLPHHGEYFVKLGDTMTFDISMMAINMENLNKNFIVLSKSVDFDSSKIIQPYDTIVADPYYNPIKIKPSKIGLDSICGEYYYKDRSYLFSAWFIVIDSTKMKTIQTIFKETLHSQ
ncbi:MAG TPA: hypothetical protein VNG53_01855 [Bacteroidia bacterium]|nr:hypothetical protein [Bacteroidia bacterium]